jgi:predicted DsbA family dithiol-disulfide isomerase
MSKTRNVFQQMSNDIKMLKEENAKLKDNLRKALQNFDNETRSKYNVEANNKMEQLKTENTLLTEKVLELEKEIQKTKNEMASLQDLNEELLQNIHSRENSFLT